MVWCDRTVLVLVVYFNACSYTWISVVSLSLSSVLLILPLTVLGRLVTNSIFRGYLYGAVVAFTCSCEQDGRKSPYVCISVENLQFLDEILLLGWIAPHLRSMDERHLQKTTAHL